MTSASHDTAVQLLTDHQRFVRLVVQREVKGPLEPPQSPHSPSLLKGLSPSGYMANRPGYKRSIGGSVSESPTTENVTVHNNSLKSNGIENNGNVPQPVPAPRRLTSQSSIGSGVNGGANSLTTPSRNGNKSEDEDIQVRQNMYVCTCVRPRVGVI